MNEKAVKVNNETNEAMMKDGLIKIDGNTITGTATGKRWRIIKRKDGAVWVKREGK